MSPKSLTNPTYLKNNILQSYYYILYFKYNYYSILKPKLS